MGLPRLASCFVLQYPHTSLCEDRMPRAKKLEATDVAAPAPAEPQAPAPYIPDDQEAPVKFCRDCADEVPAVGIEYPRNPLRPLCLSFLRTLGDNSGALFFMCSDSIRRACRPGRGRTPWGWRRTSILL